MRLSQYLIEETTPAEDIIPILRKKCGPFIRMLQRSESMYYRGLKGEYGKDNFILKKPHEDRTPMSTPKLVHDKLNELFLEKFGWKVRNGVFCAKDSIIASTYGRIHLIFGIGIFQYCWSPIYADMYLFLSGSSVKYANELKPKHIKFLEMIVDGYQDKNIEDAPKGFEVSFLFPKGYYALAKTKDNEATCNFVERILLKGK